MEDGDFELWSLGSDAAPSKTFGNVTLSLSIPPDASWRGGWYKFGYSKFLSSMGERLVNQGVSTEAGGSAITLSITGLAAGSHSLLSWHNAWDKLAAVASLTVAVNGAEAASVGVSEPTMSFSVLTLTSSGSRADRSVRQHLGGGNIPCHLQRDLGRPDCADSIHSRLAGRCAGFPQRLRTRRSCCREPNPVSLSRAPQ